MAKLYRESQKFNQWWIWLLLFASLIAGNLAGYYGYLNGEGISSLIVTGVVSALALVLLAVLELRTTVSSDGIEIGFWPFHRKRIYRSEIESAEVREYSPLGEYGGWGYRKGKAGVAYNMMGNQGLQLVLKDGKRILVGTQNPERLDELMEEYLDDESIEGLQLEALERQKVKEMRGRT